MRASDQQKNQFSRYLGSRLTWRPRRGPMAVSATQDAKIWFVLLKASGGPCAFTALVRGGGGLVDAETGVASGLGRIAGRA
jgi:hypothetical protein